MASRPCEVEWPSSDQLPERIPTLSLPPPVVRMGERVRVSVGWTVRRVEVKGLGETPKSPWCHVLKPHSRPLAPLCEHPLSLLPPRLRCVSKARMVDRHMAESIPFLLVPARCE